MTTSVILKDTHPGKPFHIVIQVGWKTLNLANTHKTEINERLPGAIETLALDLDVFSVAIPGAIQKRSQSVAATAQQRDLIREGHTRVDAIRTMIQKARAPKGIQRAYGVGRNVAPNRHASVTAALQQIVKRATDAPEEAASIGLGPVVLAEITSFLGLLNATDKTQEETRAAAPLSTKERNLVANRILQTVALIAGAGMLAFAGDPTTHASFEALVRRPKRRPSASKKSAPAEPTKTTEAAPAAPTKTTEAAPAEPTKTTDAAPAEPQKPTTIVLTEAPASTP
jgi:hypothetical protein